MGANVKFSARGNRRQQAAFGDINVTPLVDVMMVLLVIFMVTAPMMTTSADTRTADPTERRNSRR